MTKDQMREKHEERMQKALDEMEAQAQQIEPSAAMQVFVADIGTSVSSRHEGASTSPKIVYHDRPYEQIRNRHPYLESGEVEALLEHVYGQSIYLSAPHFESFSRERLAEVLAMSEEEVENLLYDEPFDDEEDSDV